MKHLGKVAFAFAAATALSSATASGAKAEELTLCWAAWDPANALVELSKDFEAKSGIDMKFEFVPWTNYADRFLNELNSKGKLCDLIIGDSQWIGGSAENGHYVKLNDFFDKEGIKMDDFVPATVVGLFGVAEEHAELLGAAGHGRRRRLDLSQGLVREAGAAEGVQGQSTAGISPRRRPSTQLKQIAEFFQNREIDGKKVYGASIYTERGSEGVTMGVMDVLYSFGFKYENPDKPYEMEGFVNSDEIGRRASSSTSRSTIAARRRARPTATWAKASTPSNPARWRCT